jgi:hypothetical protein
MSLDLDSPPLARHRARLAPHIARLLERAAARALRIHADVVSVEHVVGALMEDEDCAAHQAVCHAFADPETLDVELLALSPGTMVVGSGAALPFSPRALVALERARGAALAAGAGALDVEHLLEHAVAALPDDVRAELADAGYGAPPARPARDGELRADGHLFQGVTDPGKQALSRACKAAARAGETSIGPARVVLALLDVSDTLADACGLSRARAGGVLRGRTLDASPPTPRTLAADAELLAFLETLPDGAGSLDCLAACYGARHADLRVLLERHKIGPALLERARGAFEDPP